MEKIHLTNSPRVILKLFLWVVSALFDLCDISRGKFTNF
jgi:hypothetical protein